jgi:Tol biopolymer transport system component
MARGQIFPSEKIQRADLTLHPEFPVYQLTQTGSFNQCQYFTHPTYLPNSHRMIFTSDRTGIMELFELNVDSGEMRQLTENAYVKIFCWAISPDGRFLLYFGGKTANEIHKVDLQNLSDIIIVTRPDRYQTWCGSIIDIAPDCDTYFMTSWADQSRFPSNLFQGRISTQSFEAVFSEEESLRTFYCHQMLCPTDPNLMQINLSFPEEQGRDAAQRMWLLDLKTRKVRPVYNQKSHWYKGSERVCHEAWCPDGKHLCFVVRTNQVKVCSIKGLFGKEKSWTAGKGPNFWHVSSAPSQRYLVADTMWADSGIWIIEFVPNHPGRLFNLCKSNSQWQDPIFQTLAPDQKLEYHAHPHPGVSPDEHYIQFMAADAINRSVQLFVVENKENKPFFIKNY